MCVRVPRAPCPVLSPPGTGQGTDELWVSPGLLSCSCWVPPDPHTPRSPSDLLPPGWRRWGLCHPQAFPREAVRAQ